MVTTDSWFEEWTHQRNRCKDKEEGKSKEERSVRRRRGSEETFVRVVTVVDRPTIGSPESVEM